jgi:hypothetical protein
MKIFSPILKGTTTMSQGTTNLSGSFTGSLFGTAATASYADNFTVGGTLTAQTINVQIITSSIEFNTGSTRNGALSSNTHQFTGSVLVTGSVGIGTNSPSATLHTEVSSSTWVSKIINTNTSSNSAGLLIKAGVNSGNEILLAQKANGTSVFLVDASGNVGIGTTSPYSNARLQVNTGTNINLAFQTGTTDATGIKLNAFNDAGSANIPFELNGSILILKTGETERMRINAAGTIVMPSNQLTPSFNAFGLILQGYSGNNTWISDNLYYANGTGWVRAATGTVTQIYFDGGKIAMYTAGSDSAGTVATRIAGPYLANGGTSWTNSSDIRKKKNFEPTQGLAEILQIEPVKYNLKTDEDGATKRLGFKAQNLQTLIPEMVMETSEKAEDGSNYLGLTHDYILPVLVKAIQELKSENDTLKEILQRNNIQ